LNGKLEIESNGAGTIIRAIVPLFEIDLPGEQGDGMQVLAPSPGSARPLTSQEEPVQELWRENRATRNQARSCPD
jgi:hypothetical protein